MNSNNFCPSTVQKYGIYISLCKVVQNGNDVLVTWVSTFHPALSQGDDTIYFKKSSNNGSSFNPTKELFSVGFCEACTPPVRNLTLQVVNRNLTVSWINIVGNPFQCEEQDYRITSLDGGNTFEQPIKYRTMNICGSK